MRLGVAGTPVKKSGQQVIDTEKQRIGRINAVAKVIEFYIPTRFLKRAKWIPPQERGKVIEFCPPTKKSA